MSYYEFSFDAPIERLAIGNGAKVLYYTVVILSSDLQKSLPFDVYPKLRIIGELADHPIRGAWNPIADGRKYFILSAKFLKTIECQLGDVIEMRFNIDDQDYVEIPEDLANRLAHDTTLRAIWDQLTAGKKRFYCHQILSAKQQSTKDKRLKELAEQLLDSA